MLNTQWGTLIENVSKAVMAFIDLLKKHSGDGSRSNLFHEYFVYKLGLQPSLQRFKTVLCFWEAKSMRNKFAIKLEKGEFALAQWSRQLGSFDFRVCLSRDCR